MINTKTKVTITGLLDEHTLVTYYRFMETTHVKITHVGVRTDNTDIEIIDHDLFMEEAKALISQKKLDRKSLNIYLR